ncbi:hypothetical protein [Hymenobacter rubidus]|uniref:hypothetical protein n=1 Tax=Hymenobacter rubidus TaxID=1441626 RepID=UPI00191F9BC0|nr:hypothetical protein [Hymenobacter rubidus]
MAAPTPVLFVPECYADTAVTLTLLRENRASHKRLLNFVSHGQGIKKVGNVMRLQPTAPSNTRRVVGIVDVDKDFYEHPHLRGFTRVLSGSLTRKQHSHALLQHAEFSSQFLIAINPACEVWLLDRAAELGKTPADFGLPNDLDAFKAFCKTQDAERDPRLRNLLDAVAKAYHPAYRVLAEFVADIMDLDHPLP